MNKTPEDISNTLGTATVGIAGAGGLGSNVAIALARAGVGNLVVVDFDSVEQSNLNRQFYFHSQVGMAKVLALKENISKACPDVNMLAINGRLELGAMTVPFTDVDVVVEALDSAETKAQFIEETLLKLPNIPLVAASGVAGIGGGERIVQNNSGKLWMVSDPEARSSDEDVLLAPKVGLMAYWQANIVLELLLGTNKNFDEKLEGNN